jgi:flagellar biosynthesis/type III secretory pathway protein FliH
MMSTLFNPQLAETSSGPVAVLTYRDVTAELAHDLTAIPSGNTSAGNGSDQLVSAGPSEKEIDELVQLARIESGVETERRLKNEYDAKAEKSAARISEAIELFKAERREYFTKVESEVVHLALAIAKKILHREAQVDPMLVAALVKVAIDKLHDGSSVSVRVSPTETGKWQKGLANPLNGTTVTIVEDVHLGPGDCILETDLGSANFSIEAQLKEVEQGFFDLLAQRPLVK